MNHYAIVDFSACHTKKMSGLGVMRVRFGCKIHYHVFFHFYDLIKQKSNIFIISPLNRRKNRQLQGYSILKLKLEISVYTQE